MKDEISDLEDALEEGSKKQKRLTPAEWERLKLLWQYGTHTLKDLSEEFGIRPDTIQKRLKDEGVEKGARAHEVSARIDEESQDELAQQAAEHLKRVHQTKEEHYKWNEALGKLVMQEMIDAKNSRAAFATKDANLAALNKAAKTLQVIRNERYAILGLDNEDNDPDEMDELIVSEMTDEQIQTMQNRLRDVDYGDVEGLDGLVDEENDYVDEEGDQE